MSRVDPPVASDKPWRKKRRAVLADWVRYMNDRIPLHDEKGNEVECVIGEDLPPGAWWAADIEWTGEVFRVRFHVRDGRGMSAEALVHEWAHGMVWWEPGLDHGPRWGNAYQKAHRIFYMVD